MQEPLPILGPNFPRIVIPLLEKALLTIDVVIFDWRFYPSKPDLPVSQFNGAIKMAVERAVRVRALVQNETIRADLIAIGVDAKMSHSTKLLHTKMIVIDGIKIVLGSHNYTQHGFTENEEASVFVTMPAQANEFQEYFEHLWSAQ